jgi:hypothetical protein
MSRTIEIELAEGVASGDQNRILIIPWTPLSPHRRREIIQGEGERPSATRPMRTEARAVLTDALRDAHRWLDELTTSPNLNIGSLAAREGKTGLVFANMAPARRCGTVAVVVDGDLSVFDAPRRLWSNNRRARQIRLDPSHANDVARPNE